MSSVLAVANDLGSIQAVTPVVDELAKRGQQVVLGIPVQRKTLEIENKCCEHRQTLIFFDEDGDSASFLRTAISTFQPTLILTGSSVPRHPKIPTAEQLSSLLGQEYKIPVVAILDAWGYYPERFGLLSGQIPCIPDLICALDQNCAQDLINLGIPREKIVITNNPWMDQFCVKQARVKSSSKKNIAFISQPLAEVRWPRKWKYDQRDLFQILMEALHSLPFKPRVNVWVHPSETVYSWHELVSEYPEMATIQLEKSPKSLASVDLLVTSHSTMVYQALHMGVPCIVLRPEFPDCDDHLPDRLGLTVKVAEVASLSNVLTRTLINGANELREAATIMKTNDIFFSSGKSTNLVLDAVDKYI